MSRESIKIGSIEVHVYERHDGAAFMIEGTYWPVDHHESETEWDVDLSEDEARRLAEWLQQHLHKTPKPMKARRDMEHG